VGTNEFQILLVEDHRGDVALTKKAFSRLSTPHALQVVFDGREAMHYLHQRGRYGQAPRPHLILLDLNMPRMSGIEVLAELDQDPELKGIPVVILTTSAAQSDIRRAYALAANSYVVKPVKFSDFMALIEALETYWMKTAVVPRP
jgi:chemotaxis family two-component system response regulator Rcp1